MSNDPTSDDPTKGMSWAEKKRDAAKQARAKAVERVNALESAGASKTEIQSAKATSQAAKYAEIAAGQSLVSSNNLASASVASQKDALENLKSVASTPGMNKFDVRRANAAVKAAEALIAGVNFDYAAKLTSVNAISLASIASSPKPPQNLKINPSNQLGI